MYISIQEFCVWLVVKYDLDGNWTHYLKLLSILNILPPHGKIILGRLEPLTFRSPGSSLIHYTNLIADFLDKLVQKQCTCYMGTAHTPHACELHPTCTPNMPYTCHKPVLHRLHMHCIFATRMPYIGGTLSTCTHSWMHRHIVLHARMPQAQCTYSVYTHDVCLIHTRNTQAAHMPHSPASHTPHISHTQVCCRHAKDTHCVHIA